MTNGARPNLGGLFNGSTPPQRPSRIADPVSPRLVTTVPISETPLPPRGTGRPDPVPAELSHAESPPHSPPAAQPLAHWADPVGLVNQYFGLLRTLLDINQQWAVACATAVAALPRRVGLHR